MSMKEETSLFVFVFTIIVYHLTKRTRFFNSSWKQSFYIIQIIFTLPRAICLHKLFKPNLHEHVSSIQSDERWDIEGTIVSTVSRCESSDSVGSPGRWLGKDHRRLLFRQNRTAEIVCEGNLQVVLSNVSSLETIHSINSLVKQSTGFGDDIWTCEFSRETVKSFGDSASVFCRDDRTDAPVSRTASKMKCLNDEI